MLLCLCPVGCLSLEKLNWDSQQGRDRPMSGRNKKNSIGSILFLYYEKSLVSSNLNLKLFRFHCVRPNLHSNTYIASFHPIVQRFRPCIVPQYYIEGTYTLYCLWIASRKNKTKHGKEVGMYVRSDTMKPKKFWIQIWWYQTFLII